MVKNLLEMWEIWIQSLGQEDPLEKETAIHSSILDWRIPMDRGTQQDSVHRVAKNQTRLSNFHKHTHVCVCVKLLQSRLTLCYSMDYSPLGSTVHGILQTGILVFFAMPSSRGSSQPRDQTQVFYFFCIGRQVLYKQCHLGSPYIDKALVKSLNKIIV